METIRIEEHDGVATIAMNRPDNFNAMNNRMAIEMHEALTVLGSDRTIRVVLLTGVGDRAFCPGADAKAIARRGGPATGTAPFSEPQVRAAYQVPVLLHEMPQVTVAAINGSAAGAGLSWALACDVRFMSDRARLATAFLDRGVAGDMCIHWTLPRVVGPSRARFLMLFPRKVEAAEALAIGLVDEVFPSDVFRARVDDRVEQLRRAAPLAIQAIKQNLLDAERRTIGDLSEVETTRHFELLATDDVKEGFSAFVESRQPVFRGR